MVTNDQPINMYKHFASVHTNSLFYNYTDIFVIENLTGGGESSIFILTYIFCRYQCKFCIPPPPTSPPDYSRGTPTPDWEPLLYITEWFDI